MRTTVRLSSPSGSSPRSWAFKRLTRTIDLTGQSSGALSFYASYNVELDWDYVFVEAHTVGQDDWTTLAEAGGAGDACSGWRTTASASTSFLPWRLAR